MFDLEHENTVSEKTIEIKEKEVDGKQNNIVKPDRPSILNDLKYNTKLANDIKGDKDIRKDGVEL